MAMKRMLVTLELWLIVGVSVAGVALAIVGAAR
jgi:hypothetical protein